MTGNVNRRDVLAAFGLHFSRPAAAVVATVVTAAVPVVFVLWSQTR